MSYSSWEANEQHRNSVIMGNGVFQHFQSWYWNDWKILTVFFDLTNLRSSKTCFTENHKRTTDLILTDKPTIVSINPQQLKPLQGFQKIITTKHEQRFSHWFEIVQLWKPCSDHKWSNWDLDSRKKKFRKITGRKMKLFAKSHWQLCVS